MAKVSFCLPRNDFSFRWQMSDSNLRDLEEVSGNLLKLPAGVLQAGKLIEVSVEVLNNESLAMAKVDDPVSF